MAIKSRATITSNITSVITDGGLLTASEDRGLRTDLIDSVVSRLGDTMTGDYAITGALSLSETLTVAIDKNIILGTKNFIKYNSSVPRFQIGDLNSYNIPLYLSGANNTTSMLFGANIAATGDLILTGKLQQSSKLITLNDGGAVTTGGAVGIEVEEDSTITGYIKTNSARTGWDILAPAQAYKATFLLSSLNSDRIYTWPNQAGTVALLSDITSPMFEVGAGADSLKTINATGAAGVSAITIGLTADAGGDYAMALGDTTEASFNYSIALGQGSTTTAINQLMIGNIVPLDVVMNRHLSLEGYTGALLIHRMNSTQRDALTPANGMLIYNSQTNKFQGRENGSWVNLI